MQTEYAISYKREKGRVKSVSIKLKTLTTKNLLSLCEKMMAELIYLQEKNKALEKEIEQLQGRTVGLHNNVAQLNGQYLQLNTEVFHKPWWRKFLGL